MTKEEALEIVLAGHEHLPCVGGSCPKCFHTGFVVDPKWIEAKKLVDPMTDIEVLRMIESGKAMDGTTKPNPDMVLALDIFGLDDYPLSSANYVFIKYQAYVTYVNRQKRNQK